MAGGIVYKLASQMMKCLNVQSCLAECERQALSKKHDFHSLFCFFPKCPKVYSQPFPGLAMLLISIWTSVDGLWDVDKTKEPRKKGDIREGW